MGYVYENSTDVIDCCSVVKKWLESCTKKTCDNIKIQEKQKIVLVQIAHILKRNE